MSKLCNSNQTKDCLCETNFYFESREIICEKEILEKQWDAWTILEKEGTARTMQSMNYLLHPSSSSLNVKMIPFEKAKKRSLTKKCVNQLPKGEGNVKIYAQMITLDSTPVKKMNMQTFWEWLRIFWTAFWR